MNLTRVLQLLAILIACTIGLMLARGRRPLSRLAPERDVLQHAEAAPVELSESIDCTQRIELQRIELQNLEEEAIHEDLQTVIVECVDESGRPVKGARVFLRHRAQEPGLVGFSDEKGLLAIEPFRATAVEVLARQDRAGSGQTWVHSQLSSVFVVLYAGTVSGRVRRMDDQPLPEPMTVMIVPRRLAFERDLGRLRSRADVASTETDLNGDFLVRGVPRETTEFLVYCGGGGWLHSEVVACSLGEDQLDIRLVKAYAYVLEVVCEDADPITKSAMVSGCRIESRNPYGGQVIDTQSPGASLAGFPRMPNEKGVVRRVLAFGSPQERTDFESLSFSVAAQGFAPVEASVACLDVSEGIEATRVALHRTSGGFGEIVISDRERSVLLEEGATGRSVLYLESIDGKRSTIALPSAAQDSVVVGAPHGSYRARLRREHGLVLYPPEGSIDLVVGDEPVHIDVHPGQGSGAIALLLADPMGEPYYGSASFWISPRQPELFEDYLGMRGGGSFRFQEAPYVFRGLTTGDWYVKVMFPYGSEPQRIDVLKDDVAEASIRGEHHEPRDPDDAAARMRRFLNRPR